MGVNMDSGFLKVLSSDTLVKMVVDMSMALRAREDAISNLQDRIDGLHKENFNHVDELGSLRSQLSQLKLDVINGVGNISKEG